MVSAGAVPSYLTDFWPEEIKTAFISSDSGLVVPCISYELRSRLIEVAHHKGISLTRQLELVGRCASEMVLQLIGGSHRYCAPLISFEKFD